MLSDPLFCYVMRLLSFCLKNEPDSENCQTYRFGHSKSFSLSTSFFLRRDLWAIGYVFRALVMLF